MSFIDMMGNTVWPAEHINRRVQSLIRSQVSEDDEYKAARLYRQASPTIDDLAFIYQADTWIATCVEAGRQARADNALLAATISYESALERLSRPTDPANQDDAGEREQAQAVVDAATQAVVDLAARRSQ